jgi:hypothetical protein
MKSTVRSRARSGSVVWVARGITILVVLFMLFDVFGKFARPVQVVDAFARQGTPIGLAPLIGSLLLVLAILYALPRTSVLGAVLLTGYFGGACAVNLRAGFAPFEVLFPVLFGALVWTPLYLLDPDVRDLLPIRRSV